MTPCKPRRLIYIPNNMYSEISTEPDPVRRLYSAIALRAVRDAFDPPKKLSDRARSEAATFLFDPNVENSLFGAGVAIPLKRIRKIYRQLTSAG